MRQAMRRTILNPTAGLLILCVACSRQIETCSEPEPSASVRVYGGVVTPSEEASGSYDPMQQYMIFLVNELPSVQLFRLFLDRPQQLENNPATFAISTASLNVAPTRAGQIDTFTIPAQYQVGAGSGSKPIEVDCYPASFQFVNAQLTQLWEADYFTVPPPRGPDLRLIDNSAGSHDIDIKTNPFSPAHNEALGWYSSQSFGIQTAQGFIGMSWSPNPNQVQELTPKLTFFVTVGSPGNGSNCLINFTDINNSSPPLNAPDDFDLDGKATVTLTATGTWVISPGAPPSL